MHTFLKPFGAIFASLLCVTAFASTALESQTFVHPVSVKSASAGTGNSKSTAKKKALKKSAKPIFIKGSAETAAERSTRLKRECKGGVNAGACAGFTR
jgi:hypothetical protein